MIEDIWFDILKILIQFNHHVKVSIETGNVFYNKEMTFLSFNRYCFEVCKCLLTLNSFYTSDDEKRKKGKDFLIQLNFLP